MSELTPCNFCKLEAMRREAAKRGAGVTLVADESMPGWIGVRYADESETHRWFQEVTDRCVC